MLLNFLVYFFILLILDSGNFDIMTNFTLKIFSSYEWLSFWINLRFGCNIEVLKLIKTHPTFHRYYPCWLCLKHWLKDAFLSSRISESDSKWELLACSREWWLAPKQSWCAETSLLVQSCDAWPFLFLDSFPFDLFPDDKKIGLILRYYRDIVLCQITTVNYG